MRVVIHQVPDVKQMRYTHGECKFVNYVGVECTRRVSMIGYLQMYVIDFWYSEVVYHIYHRGFTVLI